MEDILDHFVETEGDPEVVPFSGREPSTHPKIISMIRAAYECGILNVMLNTNSRHIAQDEGFLAKLAELVDELRGKLLGSELLVRLNKLALPDWLDLNFDDIGRLAHLTPKQHSGVIWATLCSSGVKNRIYFT